MADERQSVERQAAGAADPAAEARRASAWRVTARIAALRAEERVNLLRALAVALLFAMEVLRHHDVIPAPLATPAWSDANAYHGVATDLALAWSLVVHAELVAGDDSIAVVIEGQPDEQGVLQLGLAAEDGSGEITLPEVGKLVFSDATVSVLASLLGALVDL